MTKILLLGCMVLTAFRSTSAFCDPEKYEYYRYQTPNECGKCDVCIVGEGKLTLEESGISVNRKEGSRVCIPCRPCKDGMYSSTRSNDCSLCTNCTAQLKVTVQPCTKETDAVCGGPLPSTTLPPQPTILALSEKMDRQGEEDFWITNGVMIGMIAGFVVVAAILLLATVIVGRKLIRLKNREYRSCSQNDVEAHIPQDNPSSSGHTQPFEVPPGMKFKKTNDAQDFSAASSSDDEEKALLKRAKRTKRRGSFPGRSKSNGKIPGKNISPDCDLQTDCDIGGRPTEKCSPRLQRLMSYPLDEDQNRQRQLNDDTNLDDVKASKLSQNKRTKPEYKCSCDKKLYNSSCYRRHLSRLLCNGDLYKKFGQEYLPNSSYDLKMQEIREKPTEEKSFEVVEKVFQVRTDLTKKHVSDFLRKNNRQQDIKTLEEVHK